MHDTEKCANQISVFTDDNPAPEPPPTLGEERTRKRSIEKAAKQKAAKITMTEDELEKYTERFAKKFADELSQKQSENAEARRGKHLHDARFLLKKYRVFKLYQSSQPEVVQEAYGQTTDELLEIMGCPTPESRRAQDIAKVIQETCWIIDYVDRQLEGYRLWCEKYGSSEQKRRLRIVDGKYIGESEMTNDEICCQENISETQEYRDIDDFVEDFGAMLFGIEAVDHTKKQKKSQNTLTIRKEVLSS